MTTTQRPGESIAEYVLSLRELAKDCDCVQVTAEQYKDEFTRDAFIYGLASFSIRQRLLEGDDIDFKTSIEQAETLDRAQHHSVFYSATATKQDSEPDSLHPPFSCLGSPYNKEKAYTPMLFLW